MTPIRYVLIIITFVALALMLSGGGVLLTTSAIFSVYSECSSSTVFKRASGWTLLAGTTAITFSSLLYRGVKQYYYGIIAFVTLAKPKIDRFVLDYAQLPEEVANARYYTKIVSYFSDIVSVVGLAITEALLKLTDCESVDTGAIWAMVIIGLFGALSLVGQVVVLSFDKDFLYAIAVRDEVTIHSADKNLPDVVELNDITVDFYDDSSHSKPHND